MPVSEIIILTVFATIFMTIIVGSFVLGYEKLKAELEELENRYDDLLRKNKDNLAIIANLAEVADAYRQLKLDIDDKVLTAEQIDVIESVLSELLTDDEMVTIRKRAAEKLNPSTTQPAKKSKKKNK